MTTTTNASWIEGALHAYLVEVLPAFVKNPFSAEPRLDVQKLRMALVKDDDRCISYETIYKWLRKSRLNPRNAQMIVTVANGEDNAAALTMLGRTPPAVESFNRFVYA